MNHAKGVFMNTLNLPRLLKQALPVAIAAGALGAPPAHADAVTDWNMRSCEIVVASGLLDAMSWAFMSLRQKWNVDYTERQILEAKAFDQSVVSMPANPATVVVARSQLTLPNLAEVEAILAEIRSACA
jgi:hypothetical protein